MPKGLFDILMSEWRSLFYSPLRQILLFYTENMAFLLTVRYISFWMDSRMHGNDTLRLLYLIIMIIAIYGYFIFQETIRLIYINRTYAGRSLLCGMHGAIRITVAPIYPVVA